MSKELEIAELRAKEILNLAEEKAREVISIAKDLEKTNKIGRRISDTPENSELVKRAVKEALTDKSLEELGKSIKDLSIQMATGFAEIHTKQNFTNGKVIANTNEIKIMKDRARTDKWIWGLVTALVSIVVYFLTRGRV